MATTVAVVRFPGTNCEFDVIEAVESLGGTA
jgi:phosphoribosylformylglycinamidine (FGAM) synthase-like amidotransferase family enzyme